MEPLQVQLIIEVMGRPAENVKQALASIVTRLGGEQDITILERTFHDPAPVQDAKDLYTTFADVTLEVRSLTAYFNLLFSYMPSHVELVYPERITLSNTELNSFANHLIQRMHNYDAVVKNVLVERDLFLRKVQEQAPAVFQSIMKEAPAASTSLHENSPTKAGTQAPKKKASPRKTAAKPKKR